MTAHKEARLVNNPLGWLRGTSKKKRVASKKEKQPVD